LSFGRALLRNPTIISKQELTDCIMVRTWIFLTLGLLLLVATACGADSPAGEATASPSPPEEKLAKVSSGMGSFFAINEVGLGPNGFVALTNFTDVPASLGGLVLCQGSQCFELPDVVVEAGQTVRIAAGDGAGHDGVVATRATLGELRPSDGEIALVTLPELDDPGAMLVYFQWGSTPHELTQRAIDAGLWVEGGYGPTSDNATRLFKVPETGLWLFEEP
jgi:hypothetical protein